MRANARNVRPYYPYWQYTDFPLYFDLYLYSAYATHYVYLIYTLEFLYQITIGHSCFIYHIELGIKQDNGGQTG